MLHSRFWLTSTQSDPVNFLPKRTLPYRNVRLINVIRDMFFAPGGESSFATRFRSQFEISQGNDGVVAREIPVAMVALVATAVSDSLTIY
jgi:hypothetical protein